MRLKLKLYVCFEICIYLNTLGMDLNTAGKVMWLCGRIVSATEMLLHVGYSLTWHWTTDELIYVGVWIQCFSRLWLLSSAPRTLEGGLDVSEIVLHANASSSLIVIHSCRTNLEIKFFSMTNEDWIIFSAQPTNFSISVRSCLRSFFFILW